MTKNLEKAFAEVSKLPEREQDAVAAWIPAELASERAWEGSFTASPDKLLDLGAQAVREHKEGRTRDLEGLASGQVTQDQFAAWVHKHSK